MIIRFYSGISFESRFTRSCHSLWSQAQSATWLRGLTSSQRLYKCFSRIFGL